MSKRLLIQSAVVVLASLAFAQQNRLHAADALRARETSLSPCTFCLGTAVCPSQVSLNAECAASDCPNVAWASCGNFGCLENGARINRDSGDQS